MSLAHTQIIGNIHQLKMILDQIPVLIAEIDASR